VYCVIDVQPVRSGSPDGRVARTGFWLSLFRFQGATGHTPVLPVVVPGTRRTVPDRLLRWRVSFGGRNASRGRSDGMHTVSDRWQHRQRVAASGAKKAPKASAIPWPEPLNSGFRHPTWTRYGSTRFYPGNRAAPADTPRVTAGSRFHAKTCHASPEIEVPRGGVGRSAAPLRHRLWRAKSPLDPSHATRRSKLNGLSAPPHPIALGPPGGSVRRSLISSIYRSSTNFPRS
jgi:hypothetical protein